MATIQTEGLTYRYGIGTPFEKTAVDHVDLEIEAGSFVGIIGHTGSGKSTLIQHLNGLLRPTEGKVLLDGVDIWADKSKMRQMRFRVGLVFQYPEYQIFEETVAKDIAFGPRNMGLAEEEVQARVQETATIVGLSEEILKQSPFLLSGGQKRRVAIAGVMAMRPEVLILDEPTSSLTANEVESLFRIMRELKEQGVALVYISHKMDEIKVIADEVTIMRDGQYIGKWDVANMTKEEIIAKMVGRELSNLFPPLENVPSDEVMMKVEDFTSIHPRSFRHCSFELKKGEILGVAGLVGAQRTELMEGIFGLRAHTSGKVWIKGEEVNIKQPRDAIQKSVALLTEDRRATGILGVLSVADNISIASLDALRKGPIMLDNKKILDLVATNKEKMAIKVPSPKTQIKSLSGGNQQKVLIARWLANNPDVLILDEPTRGIDVGAKYEIYCIIADLAKQGKSIIMISSEMSEIIGMSNRVMVMCDGRITGFINGKDATQENIMALATQFETAPDTAAANQ